VLVPDQAVGTDQTRRFVLVVGADGVVSARTVTPGRLVDGLRVIEEGLQGDETLVVRGVQRVRPGAAVTPRDVAPIASSALAGRSR
jgi:membrane fusion protein, multidrug efflux system